MDIICVVFVTHLGAVLLPQQGQGHALAGEFLVDAPVVRLGVGVAGARRCRKAAFQRGLVYGGDGLPVQLGSKRQADVFGDYAFGDAKGGGDLLVGLVTFEFETQRVFESAHIDPDSGHGVPCKKGKKPHDPQVFAYAQHRTDGVFRRADYRDRLSRSRSSESAVTLPESLLGTFAGLAVTLDRNTQLPFVLKKFAGPVAPT